MIEEEGAITSEVAIDYAIIQKLLPKINGLYSSYERFFDLLKQICKENHLKRTSEAIQKMILDQERNMGYCQYFIYLEVSKMDKIVLTFCSNYNGNISVDMLVKSSNDYLGLPTGKELIYNDNKYFFMLSGTTSLPSTIYINDEAFQTVIMGYSNDSIKFRLNNQGFSTQNNMPFLDCFGAVKVEMNIDGTQYTTKAIDVLVSNTNINNSVINMIQYIYDNCEKYLYEEHGNSSIKAGIKQNSIVPLETKIIVLINYGAL